MLGFNRWHLLKGLAAILCIVGIVSLALAYFIPAPPSTITIAMAFKGSSYERFALRYREKLARSHFTLNMHETDGPLDNLRLIKDQSSGVDVAFLFGGLTNSEQSPELMSLGRIAFAPIWIFYRGTETLERLTQLKGKRIAVPAGTRVVVDPILAAHGVNPDNTTMLTLAGPAAAKALKDWRGRCLCPDHRTERAVSPSIAARPHRPVDEHYAGRGHYASLSFSHAGGSAAGGDRF